MYQSSRGAESVVYMLFGGPMLVFWGLRKFEEKRLIQNTPVSKVRSAAMGLVELQGMARQQRPSLSPFSNMNSCWWSCKVQELQSSGKSSSWVTIRDMNSNTLLYLEDATGRVLVNPIGAELHVLKNTFDLNTATRTQIAPVLNGWGINDMNWFGGERRMRILEELIPDCAPLFVMGELVSLASNPVDRRSAFLARLRSIKADPVKMAEADTNHDGVVDAEEWDAFEAKQEALFNEEVMHQVAQMPNADQMMVKAPASAPFVVSTEEEKRLLNSFKWLAPSAIFGGIALSALGVWCGLTYELHWSIITGLFSGGMILGLLGKKAYMKIGGSAL